MTMSADTDLYDKITRFGLVSYRLLFSFIRLRLVFAGLALGIALLLLLEVTLGHLRQFSGFESLSPVTLVAVAFQAASFVLAPRFGGNHDRIWAAGYVISGTIALLRLIEIEFLKSTPFSDLFNGFLPPEAIGTVQMGTKTALATLFIALAMGLRRLRAALAVWLVLAGLSIPIMGLVGMSYGSATLIGNMSMSTVLMLLCNGFAALTLFPRSGFLRAVLNSAPHGRFACNQLGLGFVVLWLIGFLMNFSPKSASLQDVVTLVISGMSATLFFLISFAAQMTEKSELKRRKLERDMGQLLLCDDLTGAANRRAVDLFVRREVSKARQNTVRDRPAHIGIILIDLDHFKAVNDTYGHRTGDEVLIAVASVLRARLERTDLLARWGGEEFLVVCPAVKDMDEVHALAQTLRVALAAHVRITGAAQKLCVTASFGCALMHLEDRDQDEAVRRADHALYLAKSKGRNRVVLADLTPQMELVEAEVHIA